jgi:hypothetical protein
MKPDDVITVDDEEAALGALDKLLARGDQLVARYNLKPPITARLLDGSGNLLLAAEVNWDENGNALGPIKGGKPELSEFDPTGLFLVLTDSQGTTKTVQGLVHDVFNF